VSDLGHSLLIAFDNETPDFARGFECGRVWALMREDDSEHSFEMHTDNAEMVLRLAEASGRTVRWVEHDDTWSTAYFSERAA
jgi:diphthamide synthase (EF-2-diphthine--ammonia ligase)